MRFITRPLPNVWPSGARTPVQERRRSPFKATPGQTRELLERELWYLGADETGRDPIVFEAGYRPHEIRLDGAPRAGAKPDDPAVVISFGSRLGPLRYACDAYVEHSANLRAIALTLEHLRAVDRYGVTKRGEQYQGWAALPPGGDGDMEPAEAEAFVRHWGAPAGITYATGDLAASYRRAAKRLHPDVGGDPAQWAKLDRARRVLDL